MASLISSRTGNLSLLLYWHWWPLTRRSRMAIELAEDDRRRRLAAARAELPLVLSNLSDFAERCGEVLHKIEGNPEEADKIVQGTEFDSLRVDGKDLSALRNFVNVADVSYVEAISQILSLCQILSSRILGIPSLKQRGHALLVVDQCVVDSAEIIARVNSFWDFARGDGDVLKPIELRALLNSLAIMDFDVTTYREEAERRMRELEKVPNG